MTRELTSTNLTHNPRYQAAARTNQRSGLAFTNGDTFRERSSHSALWYTLAALALAAFAWVLCVI